MRHGMNSRLLFYVLIQSSVHRIARFFSVTEISDRKGRIQPLLNVFKLSVNQRGLPLHI